jgi:hypothetical protein
MGSYQNIILEAEAQLNGASECYLAEFQHQPDQSTHTVRFSPIHLQTLWRSQASTSIRKTTEHSQGCVHGAAPRNTNITRVLIWHMSTCRCQPAADRCQHKHCPGLANQGDTTCAVLVPQTPADHLSHGSEAVVIAALPGNRSTTTSDGRRLNQATHPQNSGST